MRESLNRRGASALAAALWFLATLAGLAGATPLRVAVISDLNGNYGSTSYGPGVERAIASIIGQHPDLVINTGDMVAGQRLHPPFDPQSLTAMWTAFHGAISDPLTRAGIPMAVTPGNHDASAYPPFQAERKMYTRQWATRRPDLNWIDGAGYPFDYAFASQDVLFVSLDVTRVGQLPQAQLDWLDALLEKQGHRYRYRIVFSHLPIYPLTQGREKEISGDPRLVALLERHRVDAYLSGHHHAYYPGWRNQILYIGQACLGAGPRRLIGESDVALHAVTWLEFDDDTLRVSARTGPEFGDVLDTRSLPRALGEGHNRLLREDLRPHTGAADIPTTRPAGSDRT